MLTKEQEDQVNKSLIPGFTPPPAPVTPGVGYDVSAMGAPSNPADTLKMAGTGPAPLGTHAPIDPNDIPPPAEDLAPPVANPAKEDSAVSRGEKSTNPMVASSHPGFDQDALEKYLMAEKGKIDEFGADKQKADFDELRKRQHGVGNTIGRALASAGDGLMQGVAGAGNPGYLEHMDSKQAHDLQAQTEMGKDLNATNMAGIKAKEGLDRQSSNNALGNSAAQAMLPMLRQIYPGKTDAEYAQMARNPAVAEGLLPEGVKLADAKARLEESKSNREFSHEMQRESMNMHRDQNYKIGLEKDTAGLDKDANFVKAQGTVDKLGTAKELLEAGNVNNASAKQALQTALTFVATGGQRVNETEMRQLGGAHTVTNRVGQWIQGLDKGTLTPKDYADMKQVISIYQHGAQQAMEQHITQKAAERAQRERISPEQARRELGHEAAAPAQSGNVGQAHPDDSAAMQWAQANPTDPRAIRIMKVNGK